jgi:TonB family protein
MPEQLMLGPESLKPLPSAAGLLREPPDESKFETDLADLAARFSVQSGGGLPPKLSADLALEIVLNEIVEQACLATGATGAAVVLEREGEMVCRASSGPTAPELGSRLDTSSGLSGECFKTRRTQLCDDTMSDPRADAEASARLGVRSVVVMPLLRGADLVGVIELFSARPYAFGLRDQRTLEVLADRTMSNLEHAAHPLDLRGHDEVAPAVEARLEEPLPMDLPGSQEGFCDAAAEVPRGEDTEGPPRRRFNVATSVLGVLAVVCAALLGLVLGRIWEARRLTVQVQPSLTTPSGGATPVLQTSAYDAGTNRRAAEPNGHPSAPAKPGSRRVPPGGLLVLKNGAEVFRLPPSGDTATNQPAGEQRNPAPRQENAVALPAATDDGGLLHRVEPEYPETARQQNIQGTVVLEVHIGVDGAVQDIRVGSGPPLLAQAASEAVKQWKFRPRLVNGSPVEMQTRITLNFRLPG